jgi:hypothetical protein
MAFGRFNKFPFRFGGGKSAHEQVHEALLASYAKVLDTSPDGVVDSEAYAEAACLAMVWAAGRRAGNQLQPTRMTDWLEPWESILLTRPAPGDTDAERRRSVAGKFRVLTNNAEPDIFAACSAILGINIVDVSYLSGADVTEYYPAINPGPPGAEWYSDALTVRVQVNNVGITSSAYDRKVAKLEEMLDGMLPTWMRSEVFRWDTEGVEDGFILDVSTLDEVGL